MASNDFEIKVEGLAELNRRLAGISAAMAAKISRRAVGAAGRVIRDEAKLRAPINTKAMTGFKHMPGTLRRAITYSSARGRDGEWRGRVYVKHGAKARAKGIDAYYWHFIEFGTRGHLIKIKNRKVLVDGGQFFGKVVQIPAIAAHPFLRPAAEAKARAAVDAMIAKIQEGLREAARR